MSGPAPGGDALGPPPLTPREKALGTRVGRGMAWMMIATVGVKAMALLGTVVLGLLLSEEDYGVYGVALGAMAIVQSFRGDGMNRVMVQRGLGKYRILSGSVGWMSLVLNLGLAGLLAGMAPVLARVYDEPRLAPVIFVAAGALPLTTFRAFFRARLQLDLRYRALAMMELYDAVVRTASLVVFALLGMGPLTFVLPLLVVGVFDAFYGWVLARDLPWLRRPRLRLWPALFARAKWVLTGQFTLAMLRNGDYLVLGAFFSTAVMGLYTFGFQIALQINTLVAMSLQQVLMPALARLSKEPARHAAAALRSATALSVIGSGAGVGLAVVFPSLSRLVWGDKWLGAVLAAQIMASAFPMRMIMALVQSSMVSKAQYAAWAGLSGVLGLGMLGAARLTPELVETAEGISLIIACYFALVVFPAAVFGLSRAGASYPRVFVAYVIPWLIALAVGAGVILGADELRGPMSDRLGRTAWLLIELALSGGLFAGGYTLGVRVLRPSAIRAAVSVAPPKVRARLWRPLLLRPDTDIKPA